MRNHFMVALLYAQTPRTLEIKEKSKGRLTMECDELWSFVGKKENKQWVWLAINRNTRKIVGVYIEQSARALWDSLPPVYCQCMVSYTDFWAAYAANFPSKHHYAVGKESGQINHIERFNCTLRQRISRLVRKSLSFSRN
ncbi:insertion element IS1 protein InsB [Gammaproteobacteria bacterium]